MKRENGADLFRIMGMLFVNMLHAYLYNGFYYEAQEGFAMWAANSTRWLVYGCNAMFMLLTGYLKTTSPWGKRYYKSLVAVLVGYVLTCVVSYPIRYFCIGERDPLPVWIDRLVTFSNYAWYVEMYIGLFLFSPLINLALDKIHEPKKMWMLAMGLLIVTVGHSATTRNLLPDYCSGMYPLALYMLGAVIRRTQPKIPAWLGIAVAMSVAFGLGLVSLKTATKDFYTGFSQGYGGFWVVLMVTALFFGVYRLRVGERCGKVLSWLSGGVFEGYILSRLFDVWIYGTVPQWHDPENYGKIFLCITIPVFILSLLAGKLVNAVSGAITGKLWKLAERIPSYSRK
jgi:surface polysaccharide O-acyltransferase-like enzyme